MPAATSASHRPGALRSRTRRWLRLYSPPLEFLSRRWGLPPPHSRFPLRSAFLADGSLPRATKRLAGGGCRSHNPAFRCVRLIWQAARFRGQRHALQVGVAAPIPPLSAALGLPGRRLATAGKKRLSCGGCFPHNPVFRCARLVLQTPHYRGQRLRSRLLGPEHRIRRLRMWTIRGRRCSKRATRQVRWRRRKTRRTARYASSRRRKPTRKRREARGKPAASYCF